jgi:hypothetical protein
LQRASNIGLEDGGSWTVHPLPRRGRAPATAAELTIRFAFDGTDYEIDLNAKNAATFSKQLAPYLERGRRAGRAQPRRPGRTAAGRQRSGDIRAWAKEHGLAVSERGRIPANVVEQCHAAGGR